MAAPERLVFISPSDPPGDWERAFRAAAPEIEFVVSRGAVEAPETIDWAVVWKPPPGALARLPNLKCVLSLGAGVDHILGDPAYPKGVPLSRVVDPYLTAGMSEYVVLHVLTHHRDLPRSFAHQAAGRWAPFAAPRADETRVGLMGLGELGLDAARKLKTFGYRLAGWSLGRKAEPGVESFAGPDELGAFLARTDILVCLLPLTAATRGLFDAPRLALLPRGAVLVNVARGAVVDEAALVEALRARRLAGAALDVFATQPLPPEHALFSLDNVLLTPHAAGLTQQSMHRMSVGAAEEVRRLLAGQQPLSLVNREALDGK